jgi:hypothetical protein
MLTQPIQVDDNFMNVTTNLLLALQKVRARSLHNSNVMAVVAWLGKYE